MQPLLTKVEGDIQYKVFNDPDAYSDVDFDFANKAEQAAYERRIENGEISFYAVEKAVKCNCCNQFGPTGDYLDFISGIDAGSPQQALEYFKAM